MSADTNDIKPVYEQDDGALSLEDLEVIRMTVPQDQPFNATKSLFSDKDLDIMTGEGRVMAKAVRNAGTLLNLTNDELCRILGNAKPQSLNYIAPESQTADLAAQFISCYTSLYALVGGNLEDMQHWLRTPNRHFNADAPLKHMQTPAGIDSVLIYLEGMASKH